MTITRKIRTRRPSRTHRLRIRTRSQTRISNAAIYEQGLPDDWGCDGLPTEDRAVNVFVCGFAAGENDHLGRSVESGGVEESARDEAGGTADHLPHGRREERGGHGIGSIGGCVG